MDMLVHCRAMAAFCRQRAAFEGENDAFWGKEAEDWDRMISEHASPPSQIQHVQQAGDWNALADGGDSLN
jgi:hypothetical protein